MSSYKYKVLSNSHCDPAHTKRRSKVYRYIDRYIYKIMPFRQKKRHPAHSGFKEKKNFEPRESIIQDQ